MEEEYGERKTGDTIVVCVQCNTPFVFSASEQERYTCRGFDPPRRCHTCRKKRINVNDLRRKTRLKPKKNVYQENQYRYHNGPEEKW